MRKRGVGAGALAAWVCCVPALGQGLMAREAGSERAAEPARGSYVNASLKRTSLLYLAPPMPREFRKHDLVTIIIDESTRQESKQTLDTKKDYSLSAALEKFPNLAAFLEGELRSGGSSPVVEGEASSKNTFKGEGKYARTDSFRARVTAEVIDVKPNGVLVLEARKIVQKDEEIQTVVLSGSCRTEDVTSANSVLSSQLADLTISSVNEGHVKDAGDKGILTRVLDAIFNF